MTKKQEQLLNELLIPQKEKTYNEYGLLIKSIYEDVFNHINFKEIGKLFNY